MGRLTRFAVAIGLVVSVVAPTSAQLITKAQVICRAINAKACGKFLAANLRVRQQCIEANLQTPGTCSAPDPEDFQRIGAKLDAVLEKKCAFNGFDAGNLGVMGYPGPCPDVDPGDGFTVTDLQACMTSSHEDRLTGVCAGGLNLGEPCATVADCPDTGPGTSCVGVISLQYDPDGFVGLPTSSTIACQRAVVKSTSHYLRTVLASIQRCRADLSNCKFVIDEVGNTVVKCKLEGFEPELCATSDPRTAKKIAITAAQLRASIRGQCSDEDAVTIGMCEPDQPTVEAGIACLIDQIGSLVQNADPDGPVDLIDYEYPE